MYIVFFIDLFTIYSVYAMIINTHREKYKYLLVSFTGYKISSMFNVTLIIKLLESSKKDTRCQ